MKFDKETIIVFAICMIVIFGWEPFCRKMGWMPERTEVKTVQKVSEQQENEKQTVDVKVQTAEVSVPETKVPEKKIDLPVLELENEVCKITFKEDYSSVDRIVFKKFLNKIILLQKICLYSLL